MCCHDMDLYLRLIPLNWYKITAEDLPGPVQTYIVISKLERGLYKDIFKIFAELSHVVWQFVLN